MDREGPDPTSHAEVPEAAGTGNHHLRDLRSLPAAVISEDGLLNEITVVFPQKSLKSKVLLFYVFRRTFKV